MNVRLERRLTYSNRLKCILEYAFICHFNCCKRSVEVDFKAILSCWVFYDQQLVDVKLKASWQSIKFD